MAIKKRTPQAAIDEDAIARFAAAAESPTPAPEPQATTEAPEPTPAAATEEEGKPKPMLLRFTKEEHALLREVAASERRSMHSMALTVLIPGLEAIRDRDK